MDESNYYNGIDQLLKGFSEAFSAWEDEKETQRCLENVLIFQVLIFTTQLHPKSADFT